MEPTDNLNAPSALEPSALAWSVLGRPLNRVEGYEHGRHARTYLCQCAEAAGIQVKRPERNEVTLEAMRAAGYADWNKFVRHLPGWHDLYQPIPRSYAEFIGATEEGVLAAVQADRDAYDRALQVPLHLHTWTLRRIAGFYELRRFPDWCYAQAECLAYVRAMCAQTGQRACIPVPGLKTFWVEDAGTRTEETCYPPGVRFTRSQIIFADDGANEATMRPA